MKPTHLQHRQPTRTLMVYSHLSILFFIECDFLRFQLYGLRDVILWSEYTQKWQSQTYFVCESCTVLVEYLRTSKCKFEFLQASRCNCELNRRCKRTISAKILSNFCIMHNKSIRWYAAITIFTPTKRGNSSTLWFKVNFLKIIFNFCYKIKF